MSYLQHKYNTKISTSAHLIINEFAKYVLYYNIISIIHRVILRPYNKTSSVNIVIVKISKYNISHFTFYYYMNTFK